ncbi:Phosphotransferase enzyme-like protein 2 [Elsinoe fawcettii]|nr:Phosphotransferase enzyme-like protein 2 [Elsinoe fawcettii]
MSDFAHGAPIVYRYNDNRAEMTQYASGTWLHRNDIELQARRIPYNMKALRDKIIALDGESSHITRTIMKEGLSNKGFIFILANSHEYFARMPFSTAGPVSLTTKSEVATMDYLRKHTSIPVPKVLDWNPDPSNPIGAEYIIMERVPGVSVLSKWDQMSMAQHTQLVRKVAQFCKQTYDLSFAAYGSIYYSDAALGDEEKIDLGDGFCLGPHVGRDWWNAAAGEAELFGNIGYDHGPWENIRQYQDAHFASAFARLPPMEHDCTKLPPFHGTVPEHYQLIGQIQTLFNEFHTFPEDIRRPTLMHPDLRLLKIMVSESDPTKITGIIDWQVTAVEPAELYAITLKPEFAMSPEQSIMRHDSGVFADMLLTHDLFASQLATDMPSISEAKTKFRNIPDLFYKSRLTWRLGVTDVREELLSIIGYVRQGKPEVVHYLPPADEVRLHEKQLQDYKLALGVKDQIVAGLLCFPDGHVQRPLWEASLVKYRQLYNFWIQMACEQQGMSREKADLLWPFDAR